MKYLCIIQARLTSTRFPNKVMQTVGGIPIVKRVWLAAKAVKKIDKVVVAWPERYPDLDENNVLERFKRIINEFNPKYIIRLTADCPLLAPYDIERAIQDFEDNRCVYHSNYDDGHDVQIFSRHWLDQANDNCIHTEHVIADFNTPYTGLSVDTKQNLERVRKIVNGR